MSDRFIKIGVFYDGNYFLHVSYYYNYDHVRRKRLSISGLHDFVRHQVAFEEGLDSKLCQIVDAHYFRGRISAQEASQRGQALYWDRVFDDILMSAGITTHYLPIRNFFGRREEKGIDVWLALEAYENCLHKKFDVLVLIASDGDYVPLVRKINTLGTRVMILSWDFEYTTDIGKKMVTRTSQDLLAEVSYPVPMHDIIDHPKKDNEALINGLFVATEGKQPRIEREDTDPEDIKTGEILAIKNGYGFIKYPPNNLFFHYTNVLDDFNELREGDHVEFTMVKNEEGHYVATEIRLLGDGEE